MLSENIAHAYSLVDSVLSGKNEHLEGGGGGAKIPIFPNITTGETAQDIMNCDHHHHHQLLSK